MAKRSVNSPDQLSKADVIACIEWLLDQDTSTAYNVFFIGIGWPEGARYCTDRTYLAETGVLCLLKNSRLACYKLFHYLHPYN